MKRLIEHVKDLSEEDLAALTIQEAGMCSAWFDSYRDLPEQEEYVETAAAVARWTVSMRGSERVTEGARHQWALRDLIDLVQDGRLADLAWDELTLLHCVNDLAHRALDHDRFERVRGLLAPHVEAIDTRIEGLEVTPGLPQLSKRLHFVTSEDIRRSGAREINVFAGIDMPSRGPVLSHTGDIRVLDSIPENCTLVVEDGSCSVEGYVMGRLAATGNCEVRENVSGTVVVRRGDIRTRNIIDGAYVVAKRGTIHCRSAQGPALVFAGTEIVIDDQAVMGKYISPSIRVPGELFGGEYHVSGHLEASRFRQSDTRPTTVVLRRRISCLDYGEVPDETASQLLSRAATLRRRLATLEQAAQATVREIEQFAGTALLYLAGTIENVDDIEELQASQRRLTILDLIVNGYASLGAVTEERLLLMTLPSGSEEADPSLGSARRDINLEPPASAGRVDGDLAEELEQMGRIRSIVLESDSTKQQAIRLLGHVRDRYGVQYKERDDLARSIERQQSEMSVARSESDVATGPKGSFPQVKALQQLASKAQPLSSDDPLGKRFHTGYVRTALRMIGTLMKRHRQCKDEIQELRVEFSPVAKELRESYNILVAERPQGAQYLPRAEGVFNAGVRLYADPFLLDETDIPDQAMHETSDSGGSTQTFVRNDNGRIEEA